MDRSSARRFALPGVPCIVLAIAGAMLLAAPAAHAYTFGEPAVRAIGPEATVFDWTTQKCASDDIPDQPTRAFRDSTGQVVLINSHHTVRRYTGPALDSVVHRCPILIGSGKSSDPSRYDNREWLATMYTPNGTNVYAIIHAEYQGWEYGPGYCIRPGRAVRGQAEVLVQRAHPRHLDQRWRELLAHDPSDALRGRPALPVRGRHRPDRLLPAQQHRAWEGRLLLHHGPHRGLRRATAGQLPAAFEPSRRSPLVARLGRHRVQPALPGPLSVTPTRPRRACARRSRSITSGPSRRASPGAPT